MDKDAIQKEKKEIDKLLIEAIRLSVMKDEAEKVFQYMDMLYFSQSLKVVEKMCEQMKVPDMAGKINKFLQAKENKEVF